jgi:hypothetical protein
MALFLQPIDCPAMRNEQWKLFDLLTWGTRLEEELEMITPFSLWEKNERLSELFQ